MALEFSEGFDSYGASADLSRKWGAVGSSWAYNAAAGRLGGGGVVGSGATSTKLRTFTGALSGGGNSRQMIGFWVKLSAAPATTMALMNLDDTSTTNVSNYIGINSGGFLNVASAQGASGFSSKSISDNAWHWVEAVIAPQNPLILYIDGILQFTYSGSAQNFTADNFYFNSVPSQTTTIDDVVAYNDSGVYPLYANFPLGPSLIATIRPTSDAAVTMATLSSGTTHYSLVNEQNGSMLDYVEDNVSGHQDLYGYAGLGFAPAAIRGVMINSYLNNPGAGSINYGAIAKSGATQRTGTSQPTPISPRIMLQEIGVDPATSAPWTPTAFAAATFGIQVT